MLPQDQPRQHCLGLWLANDGPPGASLSSPITLLRLLYASPLALPVKLPRRLGSAESMSPAWDMVGDTRPDCLLAPACSWPAPPG